MLASVQLHLPSSLPRKPKKVRAPPRHSPLLLTVVAGKNDEVGEDEDVVANAVTKKQKAVRSLPPKDMEASDDNDETMDEDERTSCFQYGCPCIYKVDPSH